MSEISIGNDENKNSFETYPINAILLPFFVETTILDGDDDRHNGLNHVLNMTNINHRLSSGVGIKGIQTGITDSWDNRNSNEVGTKFTLIPFQIKPTDLTASNTNNCKMTLSHDCFSKSDDILKKCEFGRYNTIVKGLEAVPLSTEEMKDMKFGELIGLSHNPWKY